MQREPAYLRWEPIELRDLLGEDRWGVRHHGVVSAWGLTSEVLVASRVGA